MTNDDPRPWPGDFTDYREYLRAMISYSRTHVRGFSFRAFSRRAGFSSPNFLKLVADGDRTLSEASIERFARGFDLSDEEQDAFEALVRLGRAPDGRQRARRFEALRQFATRTSVGALRRDQYEMYVRWYTVVLRELTAVLATADPTALARYLRPRVGARPVARALDLLERLGLITTDADGAAAVSTSLVSTGTKLASPAVRAFHQKMFELAARAMDTEPPSVRHASAVTLPLTPEQYGAAIARIDTFRRALLEELSEAEPGDSARIYHLAFAAFPLTTEITNETN